MIIRGDVYLINKREIGSHWEKIVTEYLQAKGCTVLCMNYRTRYSEIDVIMEDKEFLVFIEVKYRRDINAGYPGEAVTKTKQNRIRNAALNYLRENNYIIDKTNIRFDVIGILGTKIEHIENAF